MVLAATCNQKSTKEEENANRNTAWTQAVTSKLQEIATGIVAQNNCITVGNNDHQRGNKPYKVQVIDSRCSNVAQLNPGTSRHLLT